MVVAVRADRVVGPVVADGVLLDQPALVGAVAHLDALAGGREHPGPGGVLDLLGDAAVLPGHAVVVRVAVVGLEDVRVVLVVAGARTEEALVDRARVEHEDPARLAVHEEAGVTVAVGGGLLADHLLLLPGGAAVGAAAQDDPEVAGQVPERGAGVVRGEERALGGGGQRGDAVVGGPDALGRDVLGGQLAGGGGAVGGAGRGGHHEGGGQQGDGDSALHERSLFS